MGLSPSNENSGFLGFEIFLTFGIRDFSLGIFGNEIPIQEMYRDSGIFGQAQNQKSRKIPKPTLFSDLYFDNLGHEHLVTRS